MATAKQCDRCGGFFKANDVVKRKIDKEDILYNFSVIRLFMNHTNMSDDFDLCPVCAEKLYTFMNGGEFDNGEEPSGETPGEETEEVSG